MKAEKYKYGFDKRASKLATLSPDGRLRVWETVSGKLCHEWTPPSTLQTTCSCLCWATNAEHTRSSRPKKEKKKNASLEDETKNELTLGTLQGSVLLLDTNTLEVKNVLINGHSERVNDVCYSAVREALYSCSSDKHIIEWSYPTMSIKSKWKADKCGIRKLEVSEDGSCLLTAARSIKLWNLETKQLLQRFTGHVNPVTSLMFVPVSHTKKSSDDCYFLSSAEEDQIVSAWHYDPTAHERGAVSCFMTPGDLVACDLLVTEEQQIQLGVACVDGRVNVFTHVLNGKMTKPINSSMDVQLVKQRNENTPQESIALLSLKLCSNDLSVLLIYGSPIRPTFEKMKLSSLENGSKLVREVANNLLSAEPNSTRSPKKLRSAIDKSVVIVSNAVIKSKFSDASNKTVDIKGQELTLEERLNASLASNTQIKKTKDNKNERPNAASLSQMLNQGIHSDDDKLIDNVLYKVQKETVVTSTVKRLSTDAVLTLINKVVNRIQHNPSRGYDLTIWIKTVMNVHMTYLISMPNLIERLSGLYQALESRTKVYPKLSRLHGRLDLLLTHVNHRQNTAENVNDVREPLLMMEDKDESDETETEDVERLLSDDDDDDVNGNSDDDDDDIESMNESSTSEKDPELSENEEIGSDMDDD